MKRISMVAAAALTLVAVSSVWAQKGRGDEETRMERRREHLMEVIPDLTEEQLDQMQALREEGRKEMKPLQLAKQKLQRELRKLVREGANERATDAKIDEITGNQARIMKLRIAHRRKLAGILNEEQLEAFHDLGHGPGRGKRGMHRGRGGPGGPGW